MKQFISKVISNKNIAEDYYEMEFQWDVEAPLPGQFFTIRVSGQTAPLLRRPFAFSGFKENRGAMIYQIRGEGTRILQEKEPGDSLDIAGPFGNAFSEAEKNIIIAGGIGVGPMLFWAQRLKEKKNPVKLIFGCRNSALVPRCESFNQVEPVICTDDGSEGFKGNVTEYLTTLPAEEIKQSRLYSCGPHPMLKACHTFALEKKLDCFVSMEEIMACGVGACNGCIVETTNGYVRVCKEGAIFNSKDIIWH